MYVNREFIRANAVSGKRDNFFKLTQERSIIRDAGARCVEISHLQHRICRVKNTKDTSHRKDFSYV